MIRGLALIIAFLALLYFARHWGDDRTPLAVEPAALRIGPSYPPQFCPSPVPVCRGGKCPKNRSFV